MSATGASASSVGSPYFEWREPQLTRDIDLTILASFDAEEAVVDGLFVGLRMLASSPCVTGLPC